MGRGTGVRGDSPCIGVRAYYVPSLKAPGAAEWLREEFRRNPPDAIVNTTAFSARGEDTGSPLDGADCPVIQAAMAGSSEEAWRKSARALSSTDLAMHVVLPEIDGRIFAGAISFKDREASGAVFHQPARAGHRARCRPRLSLGASAAEGAARPETRADPLHLSRPAGPDRARRRPRWSRQRFEDRAVSARRGVFD